MPDQTNSVNITIDNRPFTVKKGLTILEAAEQNNIYIPTLCAHKDLTPFGGCRMCLVEVDQMRGFPTACTTPVMEGLVIRTHTSQILEERTEILRLILSEHTSSCLICDESEECKQFMGTIRKAGVTTGCRYCPSDGQCELQDVVEKMGLKDINHPIFYRNLRVEKEDPFYDRDYNLCILCGRCIRVCQEVRAANTLAFKQRGRHTLIGPAFARTHYEAGCEFCGACVEVCPTGTLAEKARKWDGKADREVTTTCTFCGVGCQMRLQVKMNQVIGSLPAEDSLINNGQLCVKGRFCVNEMVNNHQRLKVPYKKKDGTNIDILWEEAIEIAANKISSCRPDQFAMLVSPNCTNEDLYIAQKFTRVACASNNIDCLSRPYYGPAFNTYLELLKKSVPLSSLQKASTILCLGLDARFGRSVVGVELRKAIKGGAKIVTVHPGEHNLSVVSDYWLQPKIGEEAALLSSLVEMTAGRQSKTTKNKQNDELQDVSEILLNTKEPLILIGSDFIHHSESRKILEAIDQLAINLNAGVLPLPAQNNLSGTILMGTYPEFLPGGFSPVNNKQLEKLAKKWKTNISFNGSKWNSWSVLSGKKKKVLYLIGTVPLNYRPSCDFLIFQNIYPPDSAYNADLILPSAAFTEIDGTFINGEGRIQQVCKAVDPPGKAMPDWQILCKIAQKMGFAGFTYSNASEIHKEISGLVSKFKNFDNHKRDAAPLSCEGEFIINEKRNPGVKRGTGKTSVSQDYSFMEHSYHGFLLADWVEGTAKLFSAKMRKSDV